jgi:hypothetical protein
MRDGGGAGWEPAALTDIADKLRGGAKDLGDTAKTAPPGPDAGTSSGVVGAALVALVTAGATASATLETTANKVNVSRGSYDTTEGDNKDSINSAGSGADGQSGSGGQNYGPLDTPAHR